MLFRALALLCLLPSLSICAGELGLQAFLERLTDLDRLPVLEPGVASRQFSSYDRASRIDPKTGQPVGWSANGDHGHYLRVEPNGEAVLAEMQGPGCIVRIWSANPKGEFRVYLDGAEKPVIKAPFPDIFNKKAPPFAPPLASMNGRGANSFFPIPYARSCKVTVDKAHDQYFHVGYLTFPEGTPVQSLHLPLSAADREALAEASRKLAQPGQEAVDAESTQHDLPPGQAVTVAELDGPGTIISLRAKLTATERHAVRRVLLQIYWDGEASPSVECPLGDFFGAGLGTNPYASLPMSVGPDGATCRWRMPFATQARIVVTNEGSQPAKLETSVAVRPGPLAPNTARFHAKWRREDPSTTFDYPILQCEEAPGLFLGCILTVDNPDTGWWGEGDEKIHVDGEAFPSFFGTGSEDYFGDAWGFRPFVHAYHGCILGEGPGFSGKWRVYRWHVSDAVPFTKSLRMTIENYGRNKDYSSVAYWYQAHPQKDFFLPVPVADRLPRPRALRGVIEAESLAVQGATVIDDSKLPYEFSGGKALSIEAERTTLEAPVPANDVYEMKLYSARGQATPSFDVSLGETRIARQDKAFETSAECSLGKVRLAKGTAAITIQLRGQGRLVLDAIRLTPSRKQPGVLEAEALTILGATGAEPEVEDLRLPWSGDSQLFLPAPAAGADVTFRLPVDHKGRFAIGARFTRGPACGIVQAFHGDTAVGEPFDAWAEKPSAGNVVTLGTIELSPESNTLTFRVTGKNDAAIGFHVGIDFVRLVPEVVANAIEAETLKQTGTAGGGASVQGMTAWGAHKWSGGRQIFFRPKAKGASLDLEVPVKKAGTYALTVYYTRAVDYGIVQVHVDGKPLGKPFDGFHDGVVPSGAVPCGALKLDAGAHTLRFEVVGKNPNATGYFVGIDCVTLTGTD